MSISKEWINFVKELEKNKDWVPILWVTSKDLQPLIKKEFPLTKIIDLQTYRMGKYKNEMEVLDQSVIEDYLLCEKITLSMMNRMDPTRHNFPHTERVKLYYKILSYWIYAFKSDKPDLVVFDETPHTPFEYIMYEVAVKNNVKIIRFNPIHIDYRFMLFSNINETPNYIREKYLEAKSRNNILLDKKMDIYYNKLQGNYFEAEPNYMLFQRSNKGVKWFLSRVKKYLFTDGNYGYSRMKEGYLVDYYFRKYINIYFLLNGAIFKQRLLHHYNTLVSNVNISKNYIYIPLHYQPERTTSPEGGIYDSQWLMIQLLSKTIPNGWKLFVKEHSTQFHIRYSGHIARYKNYYNDILELDNVELVPLEYNSFDLIDNAKAVATVTGTAGIEAVVRNHPVLVFGNPWYQDCEGVFQIKNKSDLVTFFNDFNKIFINQDNVLAFFKVLEECSLPADNNGYFYTQNEKYDIDITNNLLKLIYKFESKI